MPAFASKRERVGGAHVMKAPSPLLGFNNNFKHKGHVYHIQTEDSGIKHPHIITHLFADGGRIVKSVKTSYASVLHEPNMAEVVRNMMKEQHKAMIIALRDGQFDPGGAQDVKLPSTGAFAHAQLRGVGQTGAHPAIKEPLAAAIVPTSSSTPRAATPPPMTPTEPALDVAALERAAAAVAGTAPLLRADDPLPPPPASVPPAHKPRGEYHDVQHKPHRPSARPPSARASEAPRPAPRPSTPPGTGKAGQTGRYSTTRPASIFATSKPTQGSIFGEDLISERSLDEVILSYLAEDLDADKK
jgi:hypothetical protein